MCVGTPTRYTALRAALDKTTSHSTRLPHDASQVHPQEVRRGCKGLKPQQHTQAGYRGERKTSPQGAVSRDGQMYRTIVLDLIGVSLVLLGACNQIRSERYESSCLYRVRISGCSQAQGGR